MIAPCPRCSHYSDKAGALRCHLTGEPEPIFWMTLKNGPDFNCFKDKNAPDRTNPRGDNDRRGGARP